MQSRKVILVSATLVALSGCVAEPPPGTERITWYAINTAGSMRIVLWDLVCERRMGNVRLSGRSETPITTCADESGRAYVRYRPDGYANRAEGWTYNRIRSGQRVLVQ